MSAGYQYYGGPIDGMIDARTAGAEYMEYEAKPGKSKAIYRFSMHCGATQNKQGYQFEGYEPVQSRQGQAGGRG